jgi:hypothetical protein
MPQQPGVVLQYRSPATKPAAPRRRAVAQSRQAVAAAR